MSYEDSTVEHFNLHSPSGGAEL